MGIRGSPRTRIRVDQNGGRLASRAPTVEPRGPVDRGIAISCSLIFETGAIPNGDPERWLEAYHPAYRRYLTGFQPMITMETPPDAQPSVMFLDDNGELLLVQAIAEHPDWVNDRDTDYGYGIPIDSNGGLYISSWESGTVKKHDIATGESVWMTDQRVSFTPGICLSADESLLFCIHDESENVIALNTSDGSVAYILPLSIPDWYNTLIVAPDGSLLAGSEGIIHHIDIGTGAVTPWVTLPAPYIRGYHMDVHPGGEGFVVAGMSYYSHWTRGTAFPVQRQLSAAIEYSWDKQVQNIYTRDYDLDWGARVYGVAYSHDGNYIFGMDEFDYTLHRWRRGPGNVGGSEPWMNLQYPTRAEWAADGYPGRGGLPTEDNGHAFVGISASAMRGFRWSGLTIDPPDPETPDPIYVTTSMLQATTLNGAWSSSRIDSDLFTFDPVGLAGAYGDGLVVGGGEVGDSGVSSLEKSFVAFRGEGGEGWIKKNPFSVSIRGEDADFYYYNEGGSDAVSAVAWSPTLHRWVAGRGHTWNYRTGSHLGPAKAIVTSEDGVTWTERSSPFDFPGHSASARQEFGVLALGWDGTQFVAGGQMATATGTTASGNALGGGGGWNQNANGTITIGSVTAHHTSAFGGLILTRDVDTQYDAGSIQFSFTVPDSWWPAEGAVYTGNERPITEVKVSVSPYTAEARCRVAPGETRVITVPAVEFPMTFKMHLYSNGASTGAGITLSTFTAIEKQPTVIATSPDGITWTRRSTPWSNTFHFSRDGVVNDLAWNGSLWVAVGHDNSPATVSNPALIMTSPDGVTWTNRFFGSLTSWDYQMRHVAWSPTLGKFLAGGEPGFFQSSDGISWSQVTPVVDGGSRTLAGNAVGTDNTLRWHPEWNVFVMTHYSAYAAGQQSDKGRRVLTSPDGVNWATWLAPWDDETEAAAWNGPTAWAMKVATGLDELMLLGFGSIQLSTAEAEEVRGEIELVERAEESKALVTTPPSADVLVGDIAPGETSNAPGDLGEWSSGTVTGSF